MHDMPKILLGLAIFALMAAFPIYYAITIAAAVTALYRWMRHLRSTPEGIRGWKGWLG